MTQETEPREDVHGTEAKLRPLTSNLSVGKTTSLYAGTISNLEEEERNRMREERSASKRLFS